MFIARGVRILPSSVRSDIRQMPLLTELGRITQRPAINIALLILLCYAISEFSSILAHEAGILPNRATKVPLKRL